MPQHIPKRILVVCTRRIGDVLLATPLVRSLRCAYPLADIDVLVFAATAGVLSGNPDISHVIPVAERSPWRERLRDLRRLWNRYDLSFSCVPSDRARLYGWAAARRHLGMLAEGETGSKRWLLGASVPFDDIDTPTVTMGLRLAELAGIQPMAEVIPPSADGNIPATVYRPFAVLHPFPKFAYKMWTEAGWIAVARALQNQGLQVVLTGSDQPDETAYCERIALQTGALSLAGQLSLAKTADLLRQASVFVGTDTAVSHLAAATGVPSVVLFGPSNPVKWGPWPADCAITTKPWSMVDSGRKGNVFLLQGVGDCVPCRLEGCDRHINSASRCLQEMPAQRVVDAALAMLGPGAATR